MAFDYFRAQQITFNTNLKNYLTKYDGKNGSKNLENQTEIEHDNVDDHVENHDLSTQEADHTATDLIDEE